jgi:hypothetical protein
VLVLSVESIQVKTSNQLTRKETIMLTKTKKTSLPATVERYVGCIMGTPAQGDRVPIDVELHISQRDLKIQNVYKYIAKKGGLDWNLFGHVTVIRRKSDGKMALINGQHRRRVVMIVDPYCQELPAHIIDVDDSDFETYGSALFSQFNGILQKALTNEELFYARVLARDAEALKMEQVLIQCGLSCGRVNLNPGTMPVAYATFAKCLKLGVNATIRAVELLKQGFRGIGDDPLHGLTFLLSLTTYKHLGDPSTKIGKDFEEWLTKAVPVFHTLKDLKFKKYRNNPSWFKGIAYGLMRNFSKFQREHSRTPAPKIAEIKKIYESGFKDEDSGLLE